MNNQAVTEAEVMRVLQETGPIKSTELVAKFRGRLNNNEDKAAFSSVLKKISRILKIDGAIYIALIGSQVAMNNQAVTEAEVRRVFQQTGPIKGRDLVARFSGRLNSSEDKAAFAAILKKISRIQKIDGANHIAMNNQAVTEAEVMRVLQQTGPIKCTDFVAKFGGRLDSSEDKAAFAAILKKISRIQKIDGANHIAMNNQAVTEAEVMRVLQQTGPIKCTDLVAKFGGRLNTSEDKGAFVAILNTISHIKKTDGVNYIAINNQGITEAMVTRVLQQTGPIKSTDLVAKFRDRLKTSEDKVAFANLLKKISRVRRIDGANYIVLRAPQ